MEKSGTVSYKGIDWWLNKAEEETHSSWKVEAYCQAALLQIKNNQNDKAIQTLDLARKSVDIKHSSLSAELLNKIAEIRSMISDKDIEEKANEAIHSAKQACENETSLEGVRDLILLAKVEIQMSRIENAVNTLDRALLLIESVSKDESLHRDK